MSCSAMSETFRWCWISYGNVDCPYLYILLCIFNKYQQLLKTLKRPVLYSGYSSSWIQKWRRSRRATVFSVSLVSVCPGWDQSYRVRRYDTSPMRRGKETMMASSVIMEMMLNLLALCKYWSALSWSSVFSACQRRNKVRNKTNQKFCDSK